MKIKFGKTVLRLPQEETFVRLRQKIPECRELSGYYSSGISEIPTTAAAGKTDCHSGRGLSS